MKTEKKIVHIIKRDKFTAGYIDFMKCDMTAYTHYFITRSGEPMDLIDYENIYYIEKDSEILSNETIKNLLTDCSQIIISGFFTYHTVCRHFSDELFRKTYIQFWGGDFYRYRQKGIKLFFMKKSVQYCIKKCRCIIVLVIEDYEHLSKILGCEKRYLEAPMPGSPRKIIDYSLYSSPCDSKVRILVGNSAAPENMHMEVFMMLAHLKNENIEIICPLSYGNEDYKQEVIKNGEKIFGDKFTPITTFIPKENYLSILAQCTIGIFNSDRQHAMGNINHLIRLGKKVYIRKNTSMWDNYTRQGIFLWDIQELAQADIASIKEQNKLLLARNSELKRAAILQRKDKWQKVFEDI